jgi:secreted trypsin-like serine protease
MKIFTLITTLIGIVLTGVVKPSHAVSDHFFPNGNVRRAQGLFSTGDVTDQIIGGLHAPIGFFTHMVSFHRRTSDGTYTHRHAGSLIAKNLILSDAYYLLDDSGTVNTEFVMENDLAYLNQYYQFQDNSNMEVHKICEIILHPEFNNKTFTPNVALYKLCEDSELAKNGDIIPVTLNKNPDLPTHHEVLTVIGWGSVQPEFTPSDDLMMVNINYINNTECTYPPPFNYTYIEDSTMCAGALAGGGRDTCRGDAGGPLMIQGNTKYNHLLVGTRDSYQPYPDYYSSVCGGDPKYPGIYVRVSYSIDWILKAGCTLIEGQCDIKTN